MDAFEQLKNIAADADQLTAFRSMREDWDRRYAALSPDESLTLFISFAAHNIAFRVLSEGERASALPAHLWNPSVKLIVFSALISCTTRLHSKVLRAFQQVTGTEQ